MINENIEILSMMSITLSIFLFLFILKLKSEEKKDNESFSNRRRISEGVKYISSHSLTMTDDEYKAIRDKILIIEEELLSIESF